MALKLIVKVPEEGYVSIRTAEILYIETLNRRSWIHTLKNEFCTYQTVKALYQELQVGCFYQPHRAFIVNMNYISGWNQTEIQMRNGRKLPLSNKRRAEFRRTYKSFCRKANEMSRR